MMQAQNYDQLIDKLAAKLAVPAAHLWAILLLQARVELIESLFGVAFGVAVLTAAWRKRGWFLTEKGDHDDMFPARVILLGFLVVVGFVAVLIDGQDAIGCLVNPEYTALRLILSAVK